MTDLPQTTATRPSPYAAAESRDPLTRWDKRGRGAMEIKPSSNPFFQTTNSRIGMVVPVRQNWETSQVKSCQLPGSNVERESISSNQSAFSFSHKTSGAAIGQGIGHSDSALSTTFRKGPSKGMIASEKGRSITAIQANRSVSEVPVASKADLINSYKHEVKAEHPIYATNANTIGSRKPDEANYTTDRAFVSQKFSNSFNAIKYRDQGLNTAVARSNVHDSLNPSWL